MAVMLVVVMLVVVMLVVVFLVVVMLVVVKYCRIYLYSFTSIDGDLSKAEDVFYGLGFMMALAEHDAKNGKMTLVYTFRF